MAYTYSKITREDTAGLGNVGQPDTPNLSASGMQELLDGLPNKIIEKFNEFIDALNEHAGSAIQSDTITNIRIGESGFEISTDGGQTWGGTGGTIEVNADAKDVNLTGYVVASEYSAISPTEKLITALAKLEAAVLDNAQAVSDVSSKISTIVEGTLPSGSTELILTSPKITANSIISPYFWAEDGEEIESIAPIKYKVETGKITYTFDALSFDLRVGITIQ